MLEQAEIEKLRLAEQVARARMDFFESLDPGLKDPMTFEEWKTRYFEKAASWWARVNSRRPQPAAAGELTSRECL
jgi:hypothetical protein